MIGVINFGLGNLGSIVNAFEKIGCEIEIFQNPDKILNYDRLILPGVGSFRVGMNNLIKQNWNKAIYNYVDKGRPLLGICLGMQCAVVEFARNVLGLEGATSSEMDKETAHPVIDLMEEQKNIQDYGGTMRLGAYDCKLKKNSRSYSAYGDTEIKERHRHRYEFNNKYLKDYEAAGMKAAGTNPDSGLVEIMEIPKHPYFVGVQFHPELKSTVMTPHPLFISFIDAVVKSKKNKLN